MKVGGRTEWLLEPTSPEEFRESWLAALERGKRVRVLGGGADLIVEDGLHHGVVMATARLGRTFRPGLEYGANPLDEDPSAQVAPADRETDPRLVAWCGASLPGLVRAAGQLGWSGLEGLVGVPGRLGGAVITNAGGRWGELWDVIETVRLLDRDGEVVDLARGDCAPRYRDGNVGDRVVLGAVLRLEPGERGEIAERTHQYLTEKRAVQPVTESSAGCIFENPDPEASEGRSAGKLIDDCGLKGLELGAAQVSPLHANFIINRGGARAADVLGLIERIENRVADETGIRLEREVRIWRADEN